MKEWGKHCDLTQCPHPATTHIWEEQATRNGWTHLCDTHKGKRVETKRDRKKWKRSALRKQLG